MRAGRLRHRIAIESRVEVRNADGDLVRVDWPIFADGDGAGLPADITALSARELVAAQARQSEVTARIVIRWMPGITEDMRVRRLDDGRLYDIAGLIEDNHSGREWITLPVSGGLRDLAGDTVIDGGDSSEPGGIYDGGHA